jgi:hypothetical protein
MTEQTTDCRDHRVWFALDLAMREADHSIPIQLQGSIPPAIALERDRIVVEARAVSFNHEALLRPEKVDLDLVVIDVDSLIASRFR